MKAKKNLIKILLLLASLEGMIALAAFLAIPSDEDASFLFGYSLSRLAAAALAAVLVIGLLYLGIRSSRNSAWLDRLVLSLRDWFQRNILFTSALITLTAVLLLLGWLLILYSDPLDTSLSRLHSILNRLIPLVVWFYLVNLKLFWLVGVLAHPDTNFDGSGDPLSTPPGLPPAVYPFWQRVLHGITWLAPVIYILLFGFITISRIAYPYELEWMESGSLVQVARVLAGAPLYTEPSIQYVPFIYTSFYLYLSALVTRVLGFGYFSLRVVSLMAAIGSGFLIYRLVQLKTGRHFPALLGAGLFAAAFPLSGGWFDIARVDSLFLFFLLLAGWLISKGTDHGLFMAGIILALAYFTKQTAVAIILALVGFSILIQPRRIYLILAPMITLLITGIFIENLLSGGWFKYYTIDLVAAHRVESNYLYHFFVEFLYRDIFSHLPLAAFLLLAGGLLFIWRQKSTRYWHPIKSYGVEILAASLILLAWGARMNAGNYLNVLMPAFAGIAIFFGLAVNEIATASSLAGKPAVFPPLYLLILLQFGLLYYNPSDHIPTTQDRAAGDRLMQTLSSI